MILCTYEVVWTDEVGDIDVCTVHGNNSKHPDVCGPHRPCLTVDPYTEFDIDVVEGGRPDWVKSEYERGNNDPKPVLPPGDDPRAGHLFLPPRKSWWRRLFKSS